MTTVRAVIFDYKAIFTGDGESNETIRALLDFLEAQEVRWCVFSTSWMDVASECRDRAFPEPHAYVSQGDVPDGRRRGSPAWIDVVKTRLSVEAWELLYVGSGELDCRTAINAGSLYIHAAWTGASRGRIPALAASDPGEVREFVESHLLTGALWSYSDDGSNPRLSIRSLLPAGTAIPSGNGESIGLKDIFTHHKDPMIGEEPARDVLMLRVITNCYLQGLLTPGTYFGVYPGSRLGSINPELEGFARPASSLVHGFFKDDLLERHTVAPDTSLVRYRARTRGVRADVTIATQASTVRIAEKYRGKLQGRNVVIYDDFMTNGISLDWARQLLQAAGTKRVVLVSVGKYGGSRYSHFDYRSSNLDPYAARTYDPADFVEEERLLNYSEMARTKILAICSTLAVGN